MLLDDQQNRNAGLIGEDLARKYLVKQGFEIVEVNFRVKGGEIDIVACKKGELHFVEVKTRSTPHYGSPFEAITRYKESRLTKAAQIFLFKNQQWAKSPKCFSVISVDLSQGDPQIVFLPNAFESVGGYYY